MQAPAWKAGALRLSGVPPAGTNLLTAAASPALHASNSACAGLAFGIVLGRGSRGAERFGGGGGGGGGAGGRAKVKEVRRGATLAFSFLGGAQIRWRAGHPLAVWLLHTL